LGLSHEQEIKIMVANVIAISLLGTINNLSVQMQGIFIPIEARVLDVIMYELCLGLQSFKALDGKSSWADDKH
jgi:hypothetical protein